MPPNIECLMENGSNIFGMMNDQYTLDYLRNIFGKYLVYMARRKEKKGMFYQKAFSQIDRCFFF